MAKNKIVGIARFNDDLGFVLQKTIKYTYEEITHKSNRYLVGSDESNLFFNVLVYRRAGSSFKAFSGRQLELIMKDGTKRTVQNDWWDFGYTSLLEEYYNYKTMSITYGSYDNLKECYVYTSGNVVIKSFKKILKKYKQKIYNYYELKNYLYGGNFRNGSLSNEEQKTYGTLLINRYLKAIEKE